MILQDQCLCIQNVLLLILLRLLILILPNNFELTADYLFNFSMGLFSYIFFFVFETDVCLFHVTLKIKGQ